MFERLWRYWFGWLVLTSSLLVSAPARADVDTFGPIEPSRPFTLLIVDGPNGGAVNQYMPGGFTAAYRQNSGVMSWISHPQTEQFRKWLSLATIKRIDADSPIAREHHSDILRDAEGFPAIALVDDSGGRWALFSGSSYPSSEYDLARSLDIYYAAVMQAAKEVGANAVRTISPQQYQALQGGRNGGLFNPTFEPKINPEFTFPDGGLPLDMNAKATIDPLTLAVIGGSVVVLVMGALIAVWIYCEAITSPTKKQ